MSWSLKTGEGPDIWIFEVIGAKSLAEFSAVFYEAGLKLGIILPVEERVEILEKTEKKVERVRKSETDYEADVIRAKNYIVLNYQDGTGFARRDVSRALDMSGEKLGYILKEKMAGLVYSKGIGKQSRWYLKDNQKEIQAILREAEKQERDQMRDQ